MRVAILIAALVSFVIPTLAHAQDDAGRREREEVRSRILARVDAILQREIDRIRGEVAGLIDEELGLAEPNPETASAGPDRPHHPRRPADRDPSAGPVRPPQDTEHPARPDHPGRPADQDPSAGPVRPPHETDHPVAAERDVDDIDLAPANLEESERTFQRAMAAHTSGRYDESIAAFQKIADSAEDEEQQATAYYNVACGYALKGDKGRALRFLRRSIETGFDDAHHIETDADLTSLHGMPEFAELIELARSGGESVAGED